MHPSRAREARLDLVGVDDGERSAIDLLDIGEHRLIHFVETTQIEAADRWVGPSLMVGVDPADRAEIVSGDLRVPLIK